MTDLPYVPDAEGWLHCVAVIDLFNRKVVAHAGADHVRAALVTEALERAITRRRPAPGLILRSDRGVRFASDGVQAVRRRQGILRSMSRRGDRYDNAVVESFFGRLKVEGLHDVETRRTPKLGR